MNSGKIDMTPEGRSQAIAGINIKLGGAVLGAIGSYALWPDQIEWWGFGVHSILLGMASVLSVLGAIRDMKKLRRVEQTLGAYQALVTPKGARMADADAMRAAGMQDARATSNKDFASRWRSRIGGTS